MFLIGSLAASPRQKGATKPRLLDFFKPPLLRSLGLGLVLLTSSLGIGCITIIDFNRCDLDEDCLPRQKCNQKQCVFGEREKTTSEGKTEDSKEGSLSEEAPRPEEIARPDGSEPRPEERFKESFPERPKEGPPERFPEIPLPEIEPDVPVQRLACTTEGQHIEAPADKQYNLAVVEKGSFLYSLDAKGLLYRWDTQAKKVTHQYRFTSVSKFSPLAALPDGSLLVVSSSTRVPQLLTFQTGRGFQPLRNLPGVRGDIRQLQFNPEGSLLGIAYSNRVDLWSVTYNPPTATTILLTSVVLDQRDVLHFGFGADGKSLFVMDDKKIEVWEIRPPANPGGPPQVAPLWTWSSDSVISHASLHPKGEMIAIAGLDKITLINLKDEKKLTTKAFRTLVYQVFFEPEGGLLFAVHGDKAGYILESLRAKLEPDGLPEATASQTFQSPSLLRSFVAWPGQKFSFFVLDEVGDTKVWQGPPTSAASHKPFFSPGRSWLRFPKTSDILLIGRNRGSVSITRGDQTLATLDLRSSAILAMAASADGKTLVIADNQGLVSYEIADLQGLRVTEIGQASAAFTDLSMSLSPQGDILAVAAKDSSEIQLRNARHPSLPVLGTLRDARKLITTLSFHPTKPLLLAGSQDQALFLWDLRLDATGTLIPTLLAQRDNAHQAAVTGVSWHPSEDAFVSIGLDRVAKVWRLVLVPAPSLTEIRTSISASPNSFERALYLPALPARQGSLLLARQTPGLNQTPILHTEIGGTTRTLAGPASPVLFFDTTSAPAPHKIIAAAFGDRLFLLCK